MTTTDDASEFVSDFWTIAEVADYLDVSRSTIVRALDRGDLERIRLTPALVRIYFPSVMEWIERSTQRPPAASGT